MFSVIRAFNVVVGFRAKWVVKASEPLEEFSVFEDSSYVFGHFFTHFCRLNNYIPHRVAFTFPLIVNLLVRRHVILDKVRLGSREVIMITKCDRDFIRYLGD